MMHYLRKGVSIFIRVLEHGVHKYLFDLKWNILGCYIERKQKAGTRLHLAKEHLRIRQL